MQGRFHPASTGTTMSGGTCMSGFMHLVPFRSFVILSSDSPPCPSSVHGQENTLAFAHAWDRATFIKQLCVSTVFFGI